MSFQQGVSGLNAASKDLDVIGNNIANAQVYGFKSFRSVFSDIFATSLQGSGSRNIGIGTRIATISPDFSNGGAFSTGRILDLAIDGQGMFRLSNNGAIAYSRNGQFEQDENGYLYSPLNLYQLTGYLADANGIIQPTAPQPIRVDTQNTYPPKATTKVPLNVTLNPQGPTTASSFSATKTIYDALGASHTLKITFGVPTPATPTSADWAVSATLDGNTVSLTPVTSPPATTTLAFDSTGLLTAPNALTVDVPAGFFGVVSGGTAAPSLTLDLTGSTRWGVGSEAGVLNSTTDPDGYAYGKYTGLNISSDGIISAQFDNNQKRNLAQIVLATFPALQRLTPISGVLWLENSDSGQPQLGLPGTGLFGGTISTQLESSTVDLTQALINLITAQRNYQANSKTISAQDQVLQTLINVT